ncbi:hypothetical protein [Fimbriimonas ginsengisoli]|uniref:Uncharacterized protein n=1 Tax=Fimbriimonas ginsengisoli Gsoil 348 TaxID=661478 RepID=A0A068NTZ3_FIMGI|nr:hypothetical protein [Fimbriimonas ginsengisoli]AIE87003.1 hypothetical protein OP10G_3635 [Fimbriimonas ginsengisoli Gsoil 348]
MSRNPASSVVDIAVQVSGLQAYMFLSAGGTVNVTGIFVNNYGDQTGNSFASTMGAATAKTLTDFAGAIPSDAVGAILEFSGAAYAGFGAQTPGYVTDFQTNPSRYAPVPASTPQVFGRVNPLTYQPSIAISALPSESHIGEVGGRIARTGDSFTRPADTTAYASGDLVANSVTAGSVTPLSFAVARVAQGSGMLRRLKLRKSNTSLTNASFRVHLYLSSPVPSNGDNGAWLTDNGASYIGSFDVTMDRVFTDGAVGIGTPTVGTEINFALTSGQVVYGLIEARAAYTPASAEVFTVILEDLQN